MLDIKLIILPFWNLEVWVRIFLPANLLVGLHILVESAVPLFLSQVCASYPVRASDMISNMIERQSLRLANLQVKQIGETICFTTTKYVASLTYYTSFQDQTSDVAPVCLWYTNGGFHVLNRNKYGEIHSPVMASLGRSSLTLAKTYVWCVLRALSWKLMAWPYGPPRGSLLIGCNLWLNKAIISFEVP